MDRPFLVAVDFSQLTEHTIAYASSLATAQNNTIDLLHVIKPPPVAARGGAGRAIYERALREKLLQRTKMVEALMDKVPELHRGRCIVREGLAAEIICEVAAEGYGLVVLATHGRTGFTHTLLGSVAELVVRTCPVPTLVVR